jgi:hypothetical protein
MILTDLTFIWALPQTDQFVSVFVERAQATLWHRKLNSRWTRLMEGV